MEQKKLRILIIDDSVIYRTQIQLALKDVPWIEIVGTAANGKSAIEKMKNLEVDICTLDIEMPILNGLETLSEMKKHSLKTQAIMFSSLTVSGAKKTLEALQLGAIDFVTKPGAEDVEPSLTHPSQSIHPADRIKNLLLPKLEIFYKKIFLTEGQNGEKKTRQETLLQKEKKLPSSFLWNVFLPKVLVIASSTGGPGALLEFFSQLKEELPFPILVTQHMPPLFTASLAERIGNYSQKVSREGIDGEVILPNQIYVAPGNHHLSLVNSDEGVKIKLDKGEMRNFVRPCADYLFESAADIFGRHTLGVVLTGMGRDGFDGTVAIKNKRGAVMIQDQESSVVFGMPGAVYEEGVFDFIGTPTEISQKILTVSRVRRKNDVA